MISLTDVRKKFGKGPAAAAALRGISLEVPSGQMLALVGRSGSGKSTLLNIIGGVDEATHGRVAIEDRSLAEMTNAERATFRRRRLGFVFQAFHLVPSLRVIENVAAPWLLDGRFGNKERASCLEMIERVGLAGLERRYPDELSGGQRQRVAIARALIRRPALLLADEPTGSLDHETGRGVLSLVTELHAELGFTAILATHADEVAASCERIVTLEDGLVLEDRSTRVSAA